MNWHEREVLRNLDLKGSVFYIGGSKAINLTIGKEYKIYDLVIWRDSIKIKVKTDKAAFSCYNAKFFRSKKYLD